MIFEHNGVNILVFGTGDIRVTTGLLVDGSDAPCVMFIPAPDEEPIGTDHPEDVGKLDIDLGVHTRLVFTAAESIDVVINALNIAKANLLSAQAHSEEETER